jgi:hypothetical protein
MTRILDIAQTWNLLLLKDPLAVYLDVWGEYARGHTEVERADVGVVKNL